MCLLGCKISTTGSGMRTFGFQVASAVLDPVEPSRHGAPLEEVELCAVSPEIYSLTLLPALSPDLQRSEQAASCFCCHSYVAMLLSHDTVKPHVKRHPSSFTWLPVRYWVIPMRK